MLVKALIYTLFFSLFLNGPVAFAQNSSLLEEIHPVHKAFLNYLENLNKDNKPFFFSACLLGKEDHNYDNSEDEKIFAFLVSEFFVQEKVKDGHVLKEDITITENLFLTYEDGLGQNLLGVEIKESGQLGYFESAAGLWTHAYATLLYEELKTLPFQRRIKTTWADIVSVAQNYECNVDYSSDLFPKGKK